MRRREFITLVGGAAAAWPAVARAQQPGRVRRIGVLTAPLTNPISTPAIERFSPSLRQAGFREGDNLSVEFRSNRAMLR